MKIKKKKKRKRAKDDGKGKVTFTRQGTNFRLAEKFNGTLLSHGTVQYFRPAHTGLWTAKVVPYERNSQKHEFKISLRIVSCFLPLSPAFLQRRRAQTAETSEKCWSKSCIPFIDIGRQFLTCGKRADIIFSPQASFPGKHKLSTQIFSENRMCFVLWKFCSVQNWPGN